MTDMLAGKVALITGAGSGIGRSAASLFAAEGASLVIADRDKAALDEAERALAAAGHRVASVVVDITDGAQVQSMVEQAVAAFGRIDCAFNNAGILDPARTTADYEEAAFARVISINLVGAWLCLKYELQQMLAQGGGAIVNNSSVLGLVGFRGASANVAAKHGVVGLTRTAALEYADKGIRVNAVCPGFIETAILESAGAGPGTARHDALVSLHPQGRLGTPDEVARVAAFLCSDAASFITGQALAIDGGLVAG